MAKIDPPKAGDLITVGLLDRIVDQLERFASLRSGSPYILLDDSPYGKLIELSLPVPTWALLSGSSSPYSFTEVRDGPGGTWVSMPNGDSGTANVYEINGKSGLAGKVVPITWTAAGDWRFQYIGVGTPSYAWTFNVSGCTGALAGAVIELYQSGVLIDSCTTGDGTGGTTLGQCILTVPGGTYDVVITGPPGAGFEPDNSSLTISATKTTNATLTVDSEHDCWSCCNYPIPHELHSTDSDGPFTLPLSYHPTTGRPRYIFASTTPVGETCDDAGVGCSCVSPGTALKIYGISFSADCKATLTITTAIIVCGGNKFRTDHSTIAGFDIQTINVTSGNCNPMNLVFTVPTTIVPGLTTPGGGGVMAFTA